MLRMPHKIFKVTKNSFLTQEWQGNPDMLKVN